MQGNIACSNCGTDFGNDVGAVGRKCPACGNGAITHTEEEWMSDLSTADVGESGQCLHANCDDDADVATVCDTGQIKHYCDEHGHGRRAGHALVEEWVGL